MKSFCYYGINDRQLKAFREDGEAVFISGHLNEPIAYVNDRTWFDWKTHKPIAFEEENIVYNWDSKKPIFVISIE